ncbi:uncharacterized protein VTP21DRAFT_517 [Calcarisporiella thermophila]|uniref:uncharacterized protein n=1 Tax=Calcarisporiella thermophila TaxID=911321 RepID=UPI0037436012
MTDQASSIYSSIDDVPLIVSPHHKLPQPINLPYDFAIIPEIISEYHQYDFKLENTVIEESQRRRLCAEEFAKTMEEQTRKNEETRRQRERELTKRLAPGFDPDADEGILQPVKVLASRKGRESEGSQPFHQHVRSASADSTARAKESLQSGNSKHFGTTIPQSKQSNLFSFLEFEQGLPPPDPWDTPEAIVDDLTALKDVLGVQMNTSGSSLSNVPLENPNNSTLFRSSTSIQASQSMAPNTGSLRPLSLQPLIRDQNSSSQLSRALSHLNISHPSGFSSSPSLPAITSAPQRSLPSPPSKPTPVNVLSNTTHTNDDSASTETHLMESSPFTSSQASNSHWGLPNLNFDSSQTPSHAQQSQQSHPQEEEKSLDLSNSESVNQLIQMGFSHDQSLDALKRYDYDLEKATNYLLDMI